MNKRLKFLLKYSILFSVFTMLITAAFHYYTDNSASKEYFNLQFTTWRIIPRFIFFFLLGYYLGYREWKKKNTNK